jgi:6-bladed beta-propeller
MGSDESRPGSRLGAGRFAVAGLVTLAMLLGSAASASASLKMVGQWGSSGTGPGQFGNANGVVYSQGSVYVGDQNLDRVQRFDPNGTLLGSWSVPFGPQQIAADQTGDLYLTAGAGNPYAIEVESSTGARIADWDGTGTPAGRLTPLGVAAANGRVYVADHTRVDVFTPSGAYITQFGAAGSGPGQFTDARRVALDAQGNVYVYDNGTPRIEKFDPAGNFITQFGTSNPTGAPSPSDTYGAVGISVSPDGFLWVADWYYFRLQKFTLSGQLAAVYQCGTAATDGVTCRPIDVTFDPSGAMYMLDNTTRIVKFTEAPSRPVLGQSVDVQVVSGKASIREPGSASFVPLTAATQIPVGSQVDARTGTIRLTAASTKANATFTGSFGGGLFSISQAKRRSAQGLTTLALLDGVTKGSPSVRRCQAPKHGADIAASTGRTLGLLHATARGKFRTRGRYSAATVRGTVWDTIDRCDGTLTVVHRGTVAVTDFRLHKTVLVHAGHRYLAKAR